MRSEGAAPGPPSAPERPAAAAPPPRRAYPAPAPLPTQAGAHGIRFDFNDGCRVALPPGSWHVRLRDLDSGHILHEADFTGGCIHSTERYYLRCRIEVWAGGYPGEPVFRHDYSAEGREVLVQLPVGTLGDTLAWFPYAVKFQERHCCPLSCAMAERIIPLLRDAYPCIRFLTHEQVEPSQYYATYSVGLLFDDEERIHQPCDFRMVGPQHTASYILGVDPTETLPRIALLDERRPLSEPYVCVAAESASCSKHWTHSGTWREIVGFLKERGYRVVCIDQEPVHGSSLPWHEIPAVEDHGGDRTLLARARWLKHAELFIGRSSCLARLARAVGTPVVMIGGFTQPPGWFERGGPTTIEAVKDAIGQVQAVAKRYVTAPVPEAAPCRSTAGKRSRAPGQADR
jgi:autotransporter strand-loop-strand O-heptosyltransferase